MARQIPKPHDSEFEKLYRQAYPNAVSTFINPGQWETEIDGVFNLDSFHPNGHLKVGPILDVMDMGTGLTYGRFLDAKHLGCLFFFGSLTLTCEPELYDCDITKQPVKVVSDLVYVGNTSIKKRVNLYLPQVKKPVAQQEVGVVIVDPDSRRPVAPGWWKDKYKPYSRPGESRISMPPFDFHAWTGRLQQEEIQVQTCDIDTNRHCHFASFVRFCYEALGRSQLRQFGYMSRDAPFRDIRSLACVFKGEAYLWDLLTVSFVQDPGDEYTYHFQILNGPKGVIFECHITFFPQILSKI